MSASETGRSIPDDDHIAVELRRAVRAGDVEVIEGLLSNDPRLASVRIVGERGGSSTALHLVADWPGYCPHGCAG